MSNKYKTTFILDTRGYTEPVEKLVEKLKTIIESAECKVLESQLMGQKAFARVASRSFPAGIYVEFTYEGPATCNGVIREKLRLDKTVNRMLVQAL